MQTASDIDIRDLRSKIGVESSVEDVLTPRLARAFLATFDEEPQGIREGSDGPAGIHWCLHTPHLVLTRQLLPDGSDDGGGEFNPPESLPRRMRAGGALQFHRPLRVGAAVTRRDRVTSVDLKQGRSGPLCFVSVQRDYHCDGGLCIVERIDSVYRGPAADDGKAASPKPQPAAPPSTGTAEPLAISPALLLRYSALTFNAHRIHFDESYAIAQEGYRGPVVHGPLQATLLLRRAVAEAAEVQETMGSFEYRSTTPLILGDGCRMVTRRNGSELVLGMVGNDGMPTMNATATFGPA